LIQCQFAIWGISIQLNANLICVSSYKHFICLAHRDILLKLL